MHISSRRSGFTLIEVVVYVALLALLAVGSTTFFIGLFRSAVSVRGEQAAVLNAAVALQAAELEIRHADAVYTPTSVFDSDAGQISLRTPRSVPTDHEFGYVDMYLDNGVLYQKTDDGTNAVALTSGDVAISVFRVERKTLGNTEGLRLTVTVFPSTIPALLAGSRTLHTFIVPRAFSGS